MLTFEAGGSVLNESKLNRNKKAANINWTSNIFKLLGFKDCNNFATLYVAKSCHD